MSRARHKSGGGVMDSDKSPTDTYAGGSSNVKMEAEEKKNGGRTKRKFKDGGSIDGMPGKKRMDRPGRKSGGRIGADKAPLSTAAKITPASGHDAPVSGNASDGD